MPLKIKKKKQKPQSHAQKMMNQKYAKLPRLKNETPRRLESLEPRVPKRSGGRGFPGTFQEADEAYGKVGKRRKGVADPRFNKIRGNKKKDPMNTVGKAISEDKESRKFKKLWKNRLELKIREK